MSIINCSFLGDLATSAVTIASSGDPEIFERGNGGRQSVSFVVLYRKCTQQTIYLLYDKRGFLDKKSEPIGGGRPLPFESVSDCKC